MPTNDRPPVSSVVVAVRLREEEIDLLDRARGAKTRSEALRASIRLLAEQGTPHGE